MLCHTRSLRQDPGESWKFADLASVKDMLLEAKQNNKFTPDPLIPFDLEPSECVFTQFMDHYFKDD